MEKRISELEKANEKLKTDTDAEIADLKKQLETMTGDRDDLRNQLKVAREKIAALEA